MTTPVSPSTLVRRRHRVKSIKSRKKIPWFAKILGGICLSILIVIPLVRHPAARMHQSPVFRPVEEGRYSPGLTVDEAILDPHSRTIKGVVENRSDKTVDDVEVAYDVRDERARLTDRPVVSIGSLKPHQSTRFETARLSSQAQWSLWALTGRPR